MDETEPLAEKQLLELPSELLFCILRSAAPPTPQLIVHNASVADVHSPRPALFVHHPARAILNRQHWVSCVRSVCRVFSEILPPPNGVRCTNICAQHLSMARPGNPHTARAGHNTWLPEDVELDPVRSTVFAYEVRADDPQSECIGAFSHSHQQWLGGSSGEDALTWYAAPHRADFTFRTKMFNGFNGVRNGTQRVRLEHARWHLVTVHLTKHRAAYWVDGVLAATADLTNEGTHRPSPGRFGMVTYASSYTWRNAVILRPGLAEG